MRGRKPKPTVLKELAGNPGHRTINKKEPKPVVVVPECPSHLKGDARKQWTWLAPELARLGILTKIDTMSLATLCTAWGDYIKAEKKIGIEGEVIISENGGGMYQNPWVGIKNRAMEKIVNISAEFGMTPSSRSRIKVDLPDEENEMAKFLFGANTKVSKS